MLSSWSMRAWTLLGWIFRMVIMRNIWVRWKECKMRWRDVRIAIPAFVWIPRDRRLGLGGWWMISPSFWRRINSWNSVSIERLSNRLQPYGYDLKNRLLLLRSGFLSPSGEKDFVRRWGCRICCQKDREWNSHSPHHQWWKIGFKEEHVSTRCANHFANYRHFRYLWHCGIRTQKQSGLHRRFVCPLRIRSYKTAIVHERKRSSPRSKRPLDQQNWKPRSYSQPRRDNQRFRRDHGGQGWFGNVSAYWKGGPFAKIHYG